MWSTYSLNCVYWDGISHLDDGGTICVYVLFFILFVHYSFPQFAHSFPMEEYWFFSSF